MRKKLIAGIMVAAVVCGAFAGCGGAEESEKSSEAESTPKVTEETGAEAGKTTEEAGEESGSLKGKKVGFSAGYSQVQHWELEIIGVNEAAKEAGVEIVYKFADGSSAQQVSDVENMVQSGIDALIIGPCDSEGITPTLESLNEKGIPVMTGDIGISNAGFVFAQVASDNYKIGVKAADYVGEQLGGKGKVAVLGWAAASATADRNAGFSDTLKEKYPDIEIVANQDCGGARQTAMETTENLLQAKNDIDFFFGCNAELALGAYNATQSANKTDVKVVAVDSDSEVMDAILAGTNLVATVAQDPYTMGYTEMTTCLAKLRGEDVKDAAIDSDLVTVDNAQKIIDRDQKYLEASELFK